MFKWIILFIIFTVYSIVMFLFGRGFGVEEGHEMTRILIRENMMLKNDLSLKSVEDYEELQSHIDWLNRFNKNCSEEC